MTPEKKINNSLDVIGEYFVDIKDACKSGYFKIETERLSEMDEILRCIQLYVILRDIPKLTGRKLEVLSYYLKFGYSKETKKKILKGLKITDSNLNNINHELRVSLKVINSVGYNQSTNEVAPDLLKFKEFIVDQKGSYILMNIK